VGGIVANNVYPAEFIRDNLAIQTHVIHAVWKASTPMSARLEPPTWCAKSLAPKYANKDARRS
jgi:hypothetical protein